MVAASVKAPALRESWNRVADRKVNRHFGGMLKRFRDAGELTPALTRVWSDSTAGSPWHLDRRTHGLFMQKLENGQSAEGDEQFSQQVRAKEADDDPHEILKQKF